MHPLAIGMTTIAFYVWMVKKFIRQWVLFLALVYLNARSTLFLFFLHVSANWRFSICIYLGQSSCVSFLCSSKSSYISTKAPTELVAQVFLVVVQLEPGFRKPYLDQIMKVLCEKREQIILPSCFPFKLLAFFPFFFC